MFHVSSWDQREDALLPRPPKLCQIEESNVVLKGSQKGESYYQTPPDLPPGLFCCFESDLFSRLKSQLQEVPIKTIRPASKQSGKLSLKFWQLAHPGTNYFRITAADRGVAVVNAKVTETGCTGINFKLRPIIDIQRFHEPPNHWVSMVGITLCTRHWLRSFRWRASWEKLEFWRRETPTGIKSMHVEFYDASVFKLCFMIYEFQALVG